VADYHTYFVGSEESGFSVWAHNADYPTQQHSGEPSTEESGLRINPRHPVDGEPTFVVRDGRGREVPVYGQAERGSSTTPGHYELMELIVRQHAETGEFEYFALQKGWRFATGSGERTIPDVIGVRRNGRVSGWEIESSSDNPYLLQTRLQGGMAALPERNQGDFTVVRPLGIKKHPNAIRDMISRGQDPANPPVVEMDWR